MVKTDGLPSCSPGNSSLFALGMVALIAIPLTTCCWSSGPLWAQQPPAGGNGSSPGDPARAATDDAEPEGAEVLPEVARSIVERTNAFRQRNDQAPLSENEALMKAAEEFAKFMANEDKYGHGADGRTPAARAKASGYEYCTVRENIAFRRGSSPEDQSDLTETFVQGWIDSPEHRENMVAEFITETGVAVATSDQSTFYAVQMFGRPKSLRFTVELANQTGETHELTVEQGGNSDSFELPPRVRMKLTRCLPSELTLNDNEQSLTVQESAQFAIVSRAGGEGAVIERSDEQAESPRAATSSDD